MAIWRLEKKLSFNWKSQSWIAALSILSRHWSVWEEKELTEFELNELSQRLLLVFDPGLKSY